MNRRLLESELKKVGVTIIGWRSFLECDVCKQRWHPFASSDDESFVDVQSGYWKCPNGCNQNARVNPQMEAITPKHVVINDIPGMIFAEEDLSEFEKFVGSMDNTEILNRDS